MEPENKLTSHMCDKITNANLHLQVVMQKTINVEVHT